MPNQSTHSLYLVATLMSELKTTAFVLTQNYPVMCQYFVKVAERIKDTGVSVRKRAIKIIRDMCTSNTNFTEFTTACIEIISRVNDDESSIQVT